MITSLREQYIREAEILGRYLLPVVPGEKEKALYADAMDQLSLTLSDREKKIWKFIMRFPIAIGPVDAILVFKNPEGNIRRKIFVMLSIMEAGPGHSDYFLPKKYSLFDFFIVLVSGIRAVFRLILGALILPFL